MTPAESVAAWSAALSFDDLPHEVVAAAKLHLLDALGCGLAAHALGVAGAGRDVMRAAGGVGEASAIGSAEKIPAPAAAFANAMLCHGLDFDDTHSDAVCHVSAVMAPAAIGAAEAAGGSGRDLLAASIAGNELVIRLGTAASAVFHRRGFHPTSVCGVFGAALAGSRLQRLDPRRTTHALGIAGSFASGIFEYLADGSETKPIHAASAAQQGLLAARLAAHGASGPASVFEGRYGLYAAFADVHGVDLGPAFADLGARWETPRIAFKPYPACHYLHGPADAAAEAVARAHAAPEDIREILVTVPEPAVALVLEPAMDKRAPKTAYDAKFSLPYSLAALLVHGRLDLESYTESAIREERVLALAAKVRYEVKAFPTYPKAFPGGARITLRDGGTLAAELRHQRGGPENPMRDAAVREKFRRNAALALDPDSVDRLEHGILELDRLHDMRSTFAILGRARAHG